MSLKMFSSKKSEQKKMKVIGIAAGKGGVGKSSVTTNLALALKLSGCKVGVLDADIYGPSIRKMLPEDKLPAQSGQSIIPAVCSGIRIISIAYFRRDNEAAVVRAPIANGIITQFLKQVDWGDTEYLLIDFPPGTGDIQLTLSQHASLSGAIMVTTPQDVAVLDVRKAMNMFDQVKVPVIGIVENMSYYYHEKTQETIHIFGRGGGERLAREAGVPLLGAIPIDPELCQRADQGKSIFDCLHETAAVKSFKNLAAQMINHLDVLQSEAKDCLQNFELVWKEMR